VSRQRRKYFERIYSKMYKKYTPVKPLFVTPTGEQVTYTMQVKLKPTLKERIINFYKGHPARIVFTLLAIWVPVALLLSLFIGLIICIYILVHLFAPLDWYYICKLYYRLKSYYIYKR